MSFFHQFTNFQQRAFLGCLAVALTFSTIFYSHYTFIAPLFLLLVMTMQGCALWEFYTMCAKKGFPALSRLAIYGSTLYLLCRFVAIQYPIAQYYDIALLFLLVVTAFSLLFQHQKTATVTLAITFFGIVYITIPMGFLLDINFIRIGDPSYTTCAWIFFLISVTKSTDICAYFTGKRFGKTPFMPTISPKKSLEGAIGGLLGSLITSFLFSASLPQCSGIEVVCLGIVIGIAAEFGDLAESLIKRNMNVKDSNALPGFGGILDMIDSTIFTSPIVYIFLKMKALI